MLALFKVKNFKNFHDEIVLDLENINNYEFNSNIIQNNVVSKGLIYGINGSGKSNFGLAILDIVLHLTDKEKALAKYSPYRNLNHSEQKVEFTYKFKFKDDYLIYTYHKTNIEILEYETVEINGQKVLEYDYVKQEGFTSLKGSENLNIQQLDQKLSFVKYVSRNTMLEDEENTRVFKKFIEFVDGMLLFYSLSENLYQGLMVGSESISKGIIEAGRIKEFEKFLNAVGIDLKLIEREVDREKQINAVFDYGEVNLFKIASTGTKSLAIFYYWYIKMEKASFVYIDEFDAFYHFELSEIVVKALKKLDNVQVILTSHNTDLMSNDLLRPDCYFLVENGEINSFSSRTMKELRKAHNIQKMYKAGAFDDKE